MQQNNSVNVANTLSGLNSGNLSKQASEIGLGIQEAIGVRVETKEIQDFPTISKDHDINLRKESGDWAVPARGDSFKVDRKTLKHQIKEDIRGIKQNGD